MGDWALAEGQRYLGETFDAANSRGVSIANGGVANTKHGSWQQLEASTSEDSFGLVLGFRASVACDVLIDLAVGASSSEQIIAPDLFHSRGNVTATQFYYVPGEVPAGTRLSVKFQSTSGSNSVRFTVHLLGQGFMPSSPLGRIAAYGPNTTDSGGVSIDPGATINTKGAWSEITSATTNDCFALEIAPGHQTNQTRQNSEWLFDVGVGAAGSEVAILSDIWMAGTAADVLIDQIVGRPIPVNIPAGTRLAVRAQCSQNDAADRLFDCVLYGLD